MCPLLRLLFADFGILAKTEITRYLLISLYCLVEALDILKLALYIYIKGFTSNPEAVVDMMSVL